MIFRTSMESLKWYSEEIQRRSDDPHGLSGLLVKMSVDFASAANSKIKLSVARADFFMKHKKAESEKPLSDRTVESMYLLTPEGVEHKKNDIYLKALTTLMSNLKSALRNAESEAKNQW